jgi:signal peptidase I
VKDSTRKIARDYGSAILVAVAVALFLRMLVIEAYRIPTSAMHPTLEPGDTIFVAKWPLGFDRKVARGDVVVFAGPADPDRDYIKRAIGIEGDTVEVKKGRVILNGQPLAANPAPQSGSAPLRAADAPCGQEVIPGGRSYEICWEPPLNEDFGPEKVPAGSIFVLGDLRNQGPADAKKRRTWGIVPVNSVRGKARWIWLSIEPLAPGLSPVRFPNFRFERLFRSIQ